MSKDLTDKAIAVKGGQKYVQVKDRITYLTDEVVKYDIDTEYQYFPERKMWVVKAKLTTPNGTYTGLAQEIESDDYKKVNFSSALENAETSAVGRACAFAGIGIVNGIASADEVHKAQNRSTYQSPAQNTLVKPGACNVCGSIAVQAKSGNWYCPEYKTHKEKGENWKIVAAAEKLPPVMQSFSDDLDNIPII